MLQTTPTATPRRALLTPTHTRAGRRLRVPQATVSGAARAAIAALSVAPLHLAATTTARPDVYAALLEWGPKARIGRTRSRILYCERFPIPKEA